MRLQLRGITKRFAATTALGDVSFDVAKGERLAVLGENGAGKSTLMKILMGVYAPDDGKMLLEGEPYQPSSPAVALSAGVSIVYQEPSFFAHLSVLENFFVGREMCDSLGNMNWRTMHQHAAKALSEFDVAPSLLPKPMGTLSLAEQQMVLIARAVDVKAQILILDEPTSILTAAEADQLFRTVDQLAAKGVTILYITHRFDEIPKVADRVVILRDGALVGDMPADQATQDAIVEKMSGRQIARVTRRETRTRGEVWLSLTGLSRANEYQDINLTVEKGEVVGLYGLVGSGRTELALSIFGDTAPDSGTMTLGGKPYHPTSTKHAISHAVAYLPEDRKTQGNFPYLSTGQNIRSASLPRYHNRLQVLTESKLADLVTHWIETLRIKAPTPKFPILGLSGGHQQKALLGRWLATDPQLLVLDEPTRGIDVGTKAEIHAEVLRLAESGMAVLIISSELSELFAVSDRIDVLREGQLVASLSGTELSEDTVLRATMGVADRGEQR